MNKLQEQLRKWHAATLTEASWLIYQRTFELSVSIAKESAILLWLLVCYVFVAAVEIWSGLFQSAKNIRGWHTQVSQKGDSNLLLEAGKAICKASKKGVASALQAARAQLGMGQSQSPSPNDDDSSCSVPVETAPMLMSSPEPLSPPSPVNLEEVESQYQIELRQEFSQGNLEQVNSVAAKLVQIYNITRDEGILERIASTLNITVENLKEQARIA